ncbi:LHFPL tetraspan subfamily member 2a protein [Patella vulgata]|uniref:LHFPL tetraspan subfamily member 2a protein n=1 Tax=Patella vulgata TaxID=6465 RepID=UPI00217FB0D6|nr:LHFPL tetraspan subfamily member 2a protein [Patella vulgata]
MVPPILLLWALLSVMVAGACTFTFLQPFWIMHLDCIHAFGMISYCYVDSDYENNRELCTAYGGYYHLGNIPSGAWQASCVLYGVGCVLMCLSAFLAICTVIMIRAHNKKLSLLSGYLQAVAVLVMGAGLLIFPLGLNSSFYQHYCGKASAPYNFGHCVVGWSYMLGIMGTALSIFCPFLSQYTDMNATDLFS